MLAVILLIEIKLKPLPFTCFYTSLSIVGRSQAVMLSRTPSHLHERVYVLCYIYMYKPFAVTVNVHLLPVCSAVKRYLLFLDIQQNQQAASLIRTIQVYGRDYKLFSFAGHAIRLLNQFVTVICGFEGFYLHRYVARIWYYC